MPKTQSDLTRAQATAYRERRKAEARALGVDLAAFVLGPGRDNDVAQGRSGVRHAIVVLAQRMAARGATYGQVLGLRVPQGPGRTHPIGEGDLLGYVVANGYCTLTPPAAAPGPGGTP